MCITATGPWMCRVSELSSVRWSSAQRIRYIRLIECNAKCHYLKKLTCKGTLRQVFYLSEAFSPTVTLYTHPPCPLIHC
jgi:hypothetical protein